MRGRRDETKGHDVLGFLVDQTFVARDALPSEIEADVTFAKISKGSNRPGGLHRSPHIGGMQGAALIKYLGMCIGFSTGASLGKSLQFPQSYLYLRDADDHAPSEDEMNVKVNQYPQLRQLCWNRPDDAVVDGEVALALYERNWRFVDRDAITPREQALLNRLVAVYGNGHLLVG